MQFREEVLVPGSAPTRVGYSPAAHRTLRAAPDQKKFRSSCKPARIRRRQVFSRSQAAASLEEPRRAIPPARILRRRARATLNLQAARCACRVRSTLLRRNFLRNVLHRLFDLLHLWMDVLDQIMFGHRKFLDPLRYVV